MQLERTQEIIKMQNSPGTSNDITRRKLADMLAACDPTAPMPEDLVAWEKAPDVGVEYAALEKIDRPVLPVSYEEK